MVVDDDEVLLEVLRAVLQDAGHEVTVRSSSLGTSAAILRERPDLVLLDVNMPGLQGDVLARLVQQRLPAGSTRIVLHSSADQGALDDLARECGASGAIQKSKRPDLFLAQVDHFLR